MSFSPNFFLRGLLLAATVNFAAMAAESTPVQDLAEQNRQLQEVVRAQQKVIDELNAKMADVLKITERHERELGELRAQPDETPAQSVTAYQRGKEVRISGEAGMAFFSTGSGGAFPKSELRVDEARLYLEAPVIKDTYFFGEIQLMTREQDESYFLLGELYVDFENVSGRFGGADRLVNFRAGRLNIPFGEEYLRRGPVANPLISHSLVDLWGIDEGFEFYGGAGRWQYVFAVQNGGPSTLHDYNADKQITVRLGWDAASWLHVSASAMRTGELSTGHGAQKQGDGISELWIGNGFFRSIGGSGTTGTFWATLAEGDATATWTGGHLSATLGVAHYDDNDTAADNARRISYGHVELEQVLGGPLFGAARYSEMRAPKGYPLAGWGNFGVNVFSPLLTDELRRLSVGLGYRLAAPLVLKVEYTWENGHYTNGRSRDHEDFFGTQIGLKF